MGGLWAAHSAPSSQKNEPRSGEQSQQEVSQQYRPQDDMLQASVCQFLLQRTQVAIMLAQGGHVVCPGFFLAQSLVQGAHLYEERASVLVVLAASPIDQPFCLLPVQLNGLTWVRLFGGSGHLESAIAHSVISRAIVVGVAEVILLRRSFQ